MLLQESNYGPFHIVNTQTTLSPADAMSSSGGEYQTVLLNQKNTDASDKAVFGDCRNIHRASFHFHSWPGLACRQLFARIQSLRFLESYRIATWTHLTYIAHRMTLKIMRRKRNEKNHLSMKYWLRGRRVWNPATTTFSILKLIPIRMSPTYIT